MEIGLYIILGSVVLVLVEAVFSYRNNSFFPSQVMAKWGKPGIAFFAHGGMWGNLLILPPLMWFIITHYSATWSIKQIVIMSGVGIAVTLANHLLLIFTQAIPDPIGWKEEKWSTVIALNFVYMSVYIALVGLFYSSPNVSIGIAVFVSVILGIYTLLGTHIILGIINHWKQWEWCPKGFLSSNVFHMQCVIWIILACLAWIASGWQAGIIVVIVGDILMMMLAAFIRFSQSLTLRPD